jgi:hypothetical protein
MRRGSMVTIEQEGREPWRWPDASRRETEFLGQRQSGRNGCEGSRTPLQRQNLAKQPAHSGLFGENREISVRPRMRGGPGRCCTCLRIQLLIPGEGQNRTIEPQIQFLPLPSPLSPEPEVAPCWPASPPGRPDCRLRSRRPVPDGSGLPLQRNAP